MKTIEIKINRDGMTSGFSSEDIASINMEISELNYISALTTELAGNFEEGVTVEIEFFDGFTNEISNATDEEKDEIENAMYTVWNNQGFWHYVS